MHVVYGMEDQRKHEVFYVGITDDIYARFLQHMRCDGSNPAKDERIREMREAGYLPLMRTLQIVVDLEQAKRRESYWTRHYYDLGMPITNQVIPMVQANVVIVREATRQELEQPKLKANMTPDEQRVYILHLLDQGMPRRKILTKIDGYIHPSIANTIIDGNVTQMGLAVVRASSDQIAKTNDSTPDEHPDYPQLDEMQAAQFVAAYRVKPNIDACLASIKIGKAYRQHARDLLKQHGINTERPPAIQKKQFTPEQELQFIHLMKQTPDIKRCLGAMRLGIGTYYTCASELADRLGLRKGN